MEYHDIVYRGENEARTRSSRRPPPRRPVPHGSARSCPDDVLLFRYSALTFNGHRIHYDRRYVTEVEGYPGLIVHGPLLATLLLDLVRRNAPDADVAGFRFRAVRPTFDLHPFRVNGEPQNDGTRAPVGAGPRGLPDHGRHRDAATEAPTSSSGKNDHAAARRPHRRHARARHRRTVRDPPARRPGRPRHQGRTPGLGRLRPRLRRTACAGWPRTSSGPTARRRASHSTSNTPTGPRR